MIYITVRCRWYTSQWDANILCSLRLAQMFCSFGSTEIRLVSAGMFLGSDFAASASAPRSKLKGWLFECAYGRRHIWQMLTKGAPYKWTYLLIVFCYCLLLLSPMNWRTNPSNFTVQDVPSYFITVQHKAHNSTTYYHKTWKFHVKNDQLKKSFSPKCP